MNQQLTPRAMQIRERMLRDIARRYGQETVEQWMSQEVKRRLINAMAQKKADEEADSEAERVKTPLALRGRQWPHYYRDGLD